MWNMDFLNGVWLESKEAVVMQSLNFTSATDAFSPRTKLILEALMALMCIGAITGNILVIVIVAATKTFHSVTSVLIINLAISDLLVGIGVMPFVAQSIMYNGWVECTDLCLYVGYTSSVYCTASVLTLAAIALDRYCCIVDCLRYASRCTLWRTGCVVLWIWMQALATSCPPLLGWSSVSYVQPMYNCAVRWASSPSYTIFMAALSYAVPAAVILFCYVKIVCVARQHARRIHSLEEYLQRRTTRDTSLSAEPSTVHPPWGNHHGTTPSSSTRDPSLSAEPSTVHPPWGNHHGTTPSSSSTLVYHLSGRFVSESPPSNPPPRLTLSFPAQGGAATAPRPGHNKNNNLLHHQQGLLRLFLVISAFFLCWTPYMGVAVVQAAEKALQGDGVRSSSVPPGAVTFSYWLVLLNSDINPLLYALLSKHFQNALRRLRRKHRARHGSSSVVLVVHGREEARDRDAGRTGTGPSTVTSSNADLRSTSATSTNCEQDSRRCSSVFTVDTEFQRPSEEHLCGGMLVPGSTSPSCSSYWDQQHPGGGMTDATETLDNLQVPSQTQEGGRLPRSPLTTERQATFFYGQITVRVEHDVC